MKAEFSMTGCNEWVLSWFAKAENDLIVANIIRSAQKGLHDILCFHCQQCAEKYLKGYLAAHEQKIEKTHDLERLLRSCSQIDPSFARLVEPCSTLSQYAVHARYPDDLAEYTQEDAAQALDHATRIKEFVLSKIL
jgi:HEPN domain-containing protein